MTRHESLYQCCPVEERTFLDLIKLVSSLQLTFIWFLSAPKNRILQKREKKNIDLNNIRDYNRQRNHEKWKISKRKLQEHEKKN